MIQRFIRSKLLWTIAVFIPLVAGTYWLVNPVQEQASLTPPAASTTQGDNAKTLAILAATYTPSLAARATQISLQSVASVVRQTPTANVIEEIPATFKAPAAPTLQNTPTPTLRPTIEQRPSAEPKSSATQLGSPLPTPQAPELLETPVLTLGELLARLIPPLAVGAIPPRLAPPTRQAISLPLVVSPGTRPAVPSTEAQHNFDSDGIERTASVPILMYHYLSVPPADADIYRLDLSVTPDRFAAHLDSLLAEGFQTISLYDLHRHLAEGVDLPSKPVVLTFDDGYRDNYENALPLLIERGMTATFFVITDYIDEGQPAYLTWDMAREMFAAGMSIESHGRTHLSFKDRENDFLAWQSLGSSETIEFQIGTRPRFVSYPAGQYDALTIEVFRSAGYWAGVTTIPGATQFTSSVFEMPRIRVRGTTSAKELIRLLN